MVEWWKHTLSMRRHENSSQFWWSNKIHSIIKSWISPLPKTWFVCMNILMHLMSLKHHHFSNLKKKNNFKVQPYTISNFVFKSYTGLMKRKWECRENAITNFRIYSVTLVYKRLPQVVLKAHKETLKSMHRTSKAFNRLNENVKWCENLDKKDCDRLLCWDP